MTTLSLEDIALLERAAQNVGIEYDPELARPHPISGAFFGLWLKIKGEPYEGQRRHWNPLQDDGDAFRLLMLLRAAKGPAWVLCLSVGDERSACEFNYVSGRDVAANTRRAIVIAAAQEKKLWKTY